mmetsp:Transcript_79350/g.224632  ORF Transcript_79350/g.224632 Transcript_79350/m.224632 type:complete len:112 (+) Transcript_79350:69-404(+)
MRVTGALVVLAAMWAPATAVGGSLGSSAEGSPQDMKNRINRAAKEVRHAKSEMRDRLLAVDREAHYDGGTYATLTDLQGKFGRAKKDLKVARKGLSKARRAVAKRHHKKHH